MSRVDIPYGKTGIALELPDSWKLEHVEPPNTPAIDLERAVRDALSSPVDGPRLRDLARGKHRVTIAVPDATRPCPDGVLLPLLLEELEAGGIRRDYVTVLMGLGMHRPSTKEEREHKFGRFLGELPIHESQGARTEDFVEVGEVRPFARHHYPVFLNRHVVEADLVIATGVVEPHQYAGFSGGRKTISIGCAGARTIAGMHNRIFLEDPGTRLGSLSGNRFHATLAAIAEPHLSFAMNVVTGGGGYTRVAAGTPGPVLTTLSAEVDRRLWQPVGEQSHDVALVGISAPKDANLYQASRALTYLTEAPRPAVRKDGCIVLAARCQEGAGRGPTEKEFLECMREGTSPDEVLTALDRRDFKTGGQRALLVARALSKRRGLVVGSDHQKDLNDCLFDVAVNPEETVTRLVARYGTEARALVVPEPFVTLPTLKAV